MRSFLAVLPVLAVLGACSSNPKPHAQAAAPASSTRDLAGWMEGDFDSAAQSRADPEYFDIRLHMHPVWTDRADGPWLYVEQARADVPDRPYRQRVYRINAEPDGSFKSRVYTLPDPPLRFAGAFVAGSPAAKALAAVSPAELKELDGCAVTLRYDAAAKAYSGGTVGTGCASTREGAAYTTSQIRLTEGALESWDRGFASDGRQVWGATKGPYRFVKQPAAR